MLFRKIFDLFSMFFFLCFVFLYYVFFYIFAFLCFVVLCFVIDPKIRGDYVLVVKFSGGGLCPSCKIHGGDFVHVYKNEQGGFCPGGDFVLHSLSLPHRDDCKTRMDTK